MNSLKQVLWNAYGGFADKRIKNFDKGSRFIIDDREPQDEDANGRLRSYFCMVFAEVLSDTEVKVTLNGNVPKGIAVEEWIKGNGANWNDGIYQTLEFEVTQGKQSSLRSLARAMRSIVARGAPRYSVKSYKYVCPRTAASLERLAEVLDGVWFK